MRASKLLRDMSNSALTVVVFILVYLWLIISRSHRAKAIWIGLAALVVVPLLLGRSPILTFSDPFVRNEMGSWAAINWNVMGIFCGTLIVAEAFIYSGVPAWCADLLIDRSPNVGWAILAVCALASVISAVAENVATVLIVAPVAMALARKLKVSSVPFIIGIAISSNLQGTATLIGDPPSMILAAHLQLNFNDFFWLYGKPGIFFAVQMGAVAGFAVLWLMFRHHKQPIVELETEPPRSWVPTAVLFLMIGGLAAASWVDPDFIWFGAAVCMTCAAGCWAWVFIRDRDSAIRILKSYDWSTTFFLAGVFMMVYALDASGVIQRAAQGISALTGTNILVAFVLIVGFSVLLSAFVDNVPYLAAMLPLVDALGGNMGLSSANLILPFGLLVGACLGGNVTPIGASANIVAYGLINKSEDDSVSFLGFVKIGLPFTLAAVATASAFLWIVWM
ncbi:MAG: SLC13 family permease [Candidatus Brocadiaceae bacterium]|jgi:Na+/H+ antiporter NhaD/arsenite permease-like protein